MNIGTDTADLQTAHNLPSRHTRLAYSGSSRHCGREYGTSQAEAIRGFLNKEATPNRRRAAYARRCWDVLEGWEPHVVEFTRGMAEGSGLTPEECTLLLLHEEVARVKHCTAFGATGRGTADGNALIGQNWDWNAALYPWPALLRLQPDTAPATLTYSYPGMWAASGINQHGLAVVWTSSCCLPQFKPVVGIPTYALLAGVLTCTSSTEALALIRRTPLAGCFIFILADAGGEVWVVEAIPGSTHFAQCHDVASRANHFELAEISRISGQCVPNPTTRQNTLARGQEVRRLMKRYRGSIDGAVAQKILSDHSRRLGLSICQHAGPGRDAMTLDSMYYEPARRTMHIARGYPCRREYVSYRV